MTTAEVLALRRADRICIGELLELEDLELQFFTMRFVDKLSLQEISCRICKSYSATSHLSTDINKKIYLLDL